MRNAVTFYTSLCALGVMMALVGMTFFAVQSLSSGTTIVNGSIVFAVLGAVLTSFASKRLTTIYHLAPELFDTDR